MDRFIHKENLKLWRRQLEETSDQDKRAILQNLIDEEEAREAEVKAAAQAKRQGA